MPEKWPKEERGFNSRGYFDIKRRDQDSDIIDYYLCRNILSLTLAQDTVINGTTIEVTDATGIVDGTYVCIQEGSRAFQAKILSVSTNTLQLDTPLDYGFTTNAQIGNRSPDMNVNGSLSSPVIFSLTPLGDATWDITRLMLHMTCSDAVADNKFGDILNGLTNGIVVRKTDGVNHTIFNVKTNGELKERCYDVDYSTAIGQGENGVRARRSFNGDDKNGSVIRLDPTKGESLEILVQDNLTSLLTFRAIAQGHIGKI